MEKKWIVGKAVGVIGALVLIFVSYSIAAAFHLSPFGGFVVFMAGGTVLIFAILGIKEKLLDRISARSLSALKARTVSLCRERFNYSLLVKWISGSLHDMDRFTVISWCSENFGLTDGEYDSGTIRGQLAGTTPSWKEALAWIGDGVRSSRPELSRLFSNIERSHKAMLTFFGRIPEFAKAHAMNDSLSYFLNLKKDNPQRIEEILGTIEESWPKFLTEYEAYNSAWDEFVSQLK